MAGPFDTLIDIIRDVWTGYTGTGKLRVDVSGSTVGSVDQGSPNSIGNAWPVKVTDGTHTLNVGVDGNLTVDQGSGVTWNFTYPPTTVSSSITANGQSATVTLSGASQCGIQITGSWTGTLVAEATVDSSNYSNIPIYPIDSAAAIASTITANGTFTLPAAGLYAFRLRSTAWTSGTAAITFYYGTGARVVEVFTTSASNMPVTANAGTNLNTSALALDTSVNGVLVTQGSTTSGQTGPLVQTATTTNAPTYTTAKTNPFSTDTSGLLRVSLKDTPANTNKFLVTADPVTFASPQHTIIDSGTTTVTQATASNLNATVVGTGTLAVQATQAGTWNINNISGTVSLPTGAATETTLAKLPLTQASTTSGQSGVLIQGAVTTAAPSYTTAQTNPLSLTTAGALRVDGSAATQPISGTVTANAGTNLNTSALNLETTQTAISAKLPATLGQKTSANSLAVVVASDQSSIPVAATLQASSAVIGHVIVDSGTLTTVSAVTAITNALPTGTNSIGQVTANAGTNLNTSALNLESTQSSVLTSVQLIDDIPTAEGGTISKGAPIMGQYDDVSTTAPVEDKATILRSTLGRAIHVNLRSNSGTEQGTVAAPVVTIPAPNASSTIAATRAVSAAYEASRVVKASSGNLYRLWGYNSKTASQFIQIHNTTTVPADTAVPIFFINVAASSNFSMDFIFIPENFSTGISVCNSSTGPTKTVGSADCWFLASYQ